MIRHIKTPNHIRPIIVNNTRCDSPCDDLMWLMRTKGSLPTMHRKGAWANIEGLDSCSTMRAFYREFKRLLECHCCSLVDMQKQDDASSICMVKCKMWWSDPCIPEYTEKLRTCRKMVVQFITRKHACARAIPLVIYEFFMFNVNIFLKATFSVSATYVLLANQ